MYFAYLETTKVVSICAIEILIVCLWMCNIMCEASFRAIGGRNVQPNEFPYIVFIEQRIRVMPPSTAPVSYIHACTASALSATVTLTAAHCCFPLQEFLHIKDRPNGTAFTFELSMVIRYDSTDGRPTNDDRYSDVLSCNLPPAGRSVFHPVMSDDVALLSTQPMPLSAYAQLSAVDQRTLYGQRVLVLGYGLTNGSGGVVESSLVLKKPVQVVDVMWSRCDDIGLVPYPLVCGMETCGRHAALCQGDSGGPALYASRIVGISVQGPTNSNCQMKTDTTRHKSIVLILPLSNYMDWIASAIAKMTTFS